MVSKAQNETEGLVNGMDDKGALLMGGLLPLSARQAGTCVAVGRSRPSAR